MKWFSELFYAVTSRVLHTVSFHAHGPQSYRRLACMSASASRMREAQWSWEMQAARAPKGANLQPDAEAQWLPEGGCQILDVLTRWIMDEVSSLEWIRPHRPPLQPVFLEAVVGLARAAHRQERSPRIDVLYQELPIKAWLGCSTQVVDACQIWF
jgi:hypothetical protein